MPIAIVRLDIDDRFVDAIDEGADAVILFGAPTDSWLRHRKLDDFAWCFVASPDFHQAVGSSTKPD